MTKRERERGKKSEKDGLCVKEIEAFLMLFARVYIENYSELISLISRGFLNN